MRISDWSSDVCSSDLIGLCRQRRAVQHGLHGLRVCQLDEGLCGAACEVHRRGGGELVGGGEVEVHVVRSEEHTSDPVTNTHLVCRLLLEKKTQCNVPAHAHRCTQQPHTNTTRV